LSLFRSFLVVLIPLLTREIEIRLSLKVRI